MVKINNYLTVEEAVKKYYPIAKKMAHGDDDLQQELLMSIMNTVGNKKLYDEGLIINRMIFQRKMYKTGYLMVDRNGSSIDRGHPRNREYEIKSHST